MDALKGIETSPGGANTTGPAATAGIARRAVIRPLTPTLKARCNSPGMANRRLRVKLSPDALNSPRKLLPSGASRPRRQLLGSPPSASQSTSLAGISSVSSVAGDGTSGSANATPTNGGGGGLDSAELLLQEGELSVAIRKKALQIMCRANLATNEDMLFLVCDPHLNSEMRVEAVRLCGVHCMDTPQLRRKLEYLCDKDKPGYERLRVTAAISLLRITDWKHTRAHVSVYKMLHSGDEAVAAASRSGSAAASTIGGGSGSGGGGIRKRGNRLLRRAQQAGLDGSSGWLEGIGSPASKIEQRPSISASNDARVVALSIVGKELPELISDGYLVYLLHVAPPGSALLDAAVRCCGGRRSTILLPLLVAKLADPNLQDQVVSALLTFSDESVLEHVGPLLQDAVQESVRLIFDTGGAQPRRALPSSPNNDGASALPRAQIEGCARWMCKCQLESPEEDLEACTAAALGAIHSAVEFINDKLEHSLPQPASTVAGDSAPVSAAVSEDDGAGDSDAVVAGSGSEDVDFSGRQARSVSVLEPLIDFLLQASPDPSMTVRERVTRMFSFWTPDSSSASSPLGGQDSNSNAFAEGGEKFGGEMALLSLVVGAIENTIAGLLAALRGHQNQDPLSAVRLGAVLRHVVRVLMKICAIRFFPSSLSVDLVFEALLSRNVEHSAAAREVVENLLDGDYREQVLPTLTHWIEADRHLLLGDEDGNEDNKSEQGDGNTSNSNSRGLSHRSSRRRRRSKGGADAASAENEGHSEHSTSSSHEDGDGLDLGDSDTDGGSTSGGGALSGADSDTDGGSILRPASPVMTAPKLSAIQVLRVLMHSSLFQNVPLEDLQRLVATEGTVTQKLVRAGTVFAEAGDREEEIFIVARGVVTVYVPGHDEASKDPVVATLGIGDCIGERRLSALFNSGGGGVGSQLERETSASAATDCTLVLVSLSRLSSLLRVSPSILRGVLSVLLLDLRRCWLFRIHTMHRNRRRKSHKITQSAVSAALSGSVGGLLAGSSLGAETPPTSPRNAAVVARNTNTHNNNNNTLDTFDESKALQKQFSRLVRRGGASGAAGAGLHLVSGARTAVKGSPCSRLSVLELCIFLKDAYAFRGLSMSTIRALAECADQRLFLSGERVYCEGDQADFLFLAVEGSCHLYSSGGSGAAGGGGNLAGGVLVGDIADAAGVAEDAGAAGTMAREVVVGRVGSGGVAGELSLVPQSSRLVTCAVAPQSFRGEALLLCFEAALVLRLMSRDPSLSRAVATHVLRRLDKERQRLERRGQGSARGGDVTAMGQALRTFSADGDVKADMPDSGVGAGERNGSGGAVAGPKSFGRPKGHAWATLRKSVVTLGPSDRASLLRASVAAGLSSSPRGNGLGGGARRRHRRARGTRRQRTATANEILVGPSARIKELTHRQADTKKAK